MQLLAGLFRQVILPILKQNADCFWVPNDPACWCSQGLCAITSCCCCCRHCCWCRFVLRHPLVASAVIGASSQQQLQELLAAAAEGPLQDEQLLEAIDKLHQQYPNPTP
jgi:hypothetical protein